MKKSALLLLALPVAATLFMAQQQFVYNGATVNGSIVITAAGVLQQIYPAVANPNANFASNRHSLTLQNNNGTNSTSSSDVCYIVYGQNITPLITAGVTSITSTVTFNGVSTPVGKLAQRLTNAGASGAYFPFIPSDPIFGTCDNSSDSIYADTK